MVDFNQQAKTTIQKNTKPQSLSKWVSVKLQKNDPLWPLQIQHIPKEWNLVTGLWSAAVTLNPQLHIFLVTPFSLSDSQTHTLFLSQQAVLCIIFLDWPIRYSNCVKNCKKKIPKDEQMNLSYFWIFTREVNTSLIIRKCILSNIFLLNCSYDLINWRYW